MTCISSPVVCHQFPVIPEKWWRKEEEKQVRIFAFQTNAIIAAKIFFLKLKKIATDVYAFKNDDYGIHLGNWLFCEVSSCDNHKRLSK